MNMQELLEDFVLLKLIAPQPTKPRSHPIHQYRQYHIDDSTMSVEHEYKIVSCLSFLCAVTDDSKKVSAICLERGAGPNACLIRVAMNTGVPETRILDLEKLARALQDARRPGKYGIDIC